MKKTIKLALAALIITTVTGCSGLAAKYEAHVDRMNEKHADNPNFESYMHGSNWHYYDKESQYAAPVGS